MRTQAFLVTTFLAALYSAPPTALAFNLGENNANTGGAPRTAAMGASTYPRPSLGQSQAGFLGFTTNGDKVDKAKEIKK